MRAYKTQRSAKTRKLRNGITLLEVVLSLAILAMSAGILATVARTATDNGLTAHRLATAQILAESKMAEVVTGAIPLQGAVGWMPVNDIVPQGNWYFQIQSTSGVRKDMIGVRLSVTDEAGMSENKEVFFIVRWMIDPTLGLDALPTTSGGTGTTGTAGTTGAAAPAGGVQ